MSSGGVYRLASADGKADKMLTANELLSRRLTAVMCARQKLGHDQTPTLADIRRTHILYVDAHYSPFVAIAMDYGKVRPSSGTPQWGANMQFSIPQNGDFFSDMVVNVQLAQTQATIGSVPAFPAYIGEDDQVTTATSSVSATEDTVADVYTRYTYEYVNLAGTVQTVGDPVRNHVRYAEYVGARLFDEVKFDVNSNPLDQYGPQDVIFHQKFQVPPQKMTGWKRMLGQEVPIEAISDLTGITGAASAPAAAVDLEDINGQPAEGALVSASNTTRKLLQIVNGPQTPKASQPALDLWVPLIFWFNRNSHLAIPSIAIPYGQRFINIKLARQDEVLFTAPGNLFLRLTVEQSTSADITGGTAAAIAVTSVSKYVTLTPVLVADSVIDTSQQVMNADLYINNLFLNQAVHDIYIKRIGFSLIRIHKSQNQYLTVNSGDVLLSSMKYPIESMYVGIRPRWNIDATNPNKYRDWHRLSHLEDFEEWEFARARSDVMVDDAVAFNAANAAHKRTFSQEASGRYVWAAENPTITTLGLESGGNKLFDNISTAFYRDYQPYVFSENSLLNTPEDSGALFVNFALHPGSYQPSGHLNFSRARETYLKYTSDYVDASTQGQLLVSADAINFLLVTDGSAVLRFST